MVFSYGDCRILNGQTADPEPTGKINAIMAEGLQVSGGLGSSGFPGFGMVSSSDLADRMRSAGRAAPSNSRLAEGRRGDRPASWSRLRQR